MKITARIDLTESEHVNNFLRAKLQAEIDNKQSHNYKSFSEFAIIEYCKIVIMESGIDES